MNGTIFKNRTDAGQQLAKRLVQYKPDRPLILALPRGGVPVGCAVAEELDAPLDTLVARKIGTPDNPEFAVGAIAPGDVIVVDQASVQSLGLEEKDLDPILEEEMKEMDRRMVRYNSGEYSKDSTADIVILVDDGLATGLTARAAVGSVNIIVKPKKIILAAPICSHATAQQLRGVVDEVVCLSQVDELIAIGYWYQEFNQTTDEEVIRCLQKANKKYRKK